LANFTVIYDACIFYPAPLRDLMVRLAMTREFRAHWTMQIHEEWVTALLRSRQDLRREDLDRTVDLCNKAVPDCLVCHYESLIDDINLPDPDDRHVVAAAIRAGAQCIVTLNLKDFPSEALDQYDMFARHPDDFILDLAELEPDVVIKTVKAQREPLTNPHPTAEEFLDRLRRNRLPGVATFLSDWIEVI
jgi:predicted nucleic acid-binding protein